MESCSNSNREEVIIFLTLPSVHNSTSTVPVLVQYEESKSIYPGYGKPRSSCGKGREFVIYPNGYLLFITYILILG